MLIEYEIIDEKMTICSTKHGNISNAIVDILFKRRMEYHITNTFLQTLLLVLVGFMTFFFDVDNFTDKIMVNLTTMLVIATLMSSIQSVIKTVFSVNQMNQNLKSPFSEPTKDLLLQIDRLLVHVLPVCFHHHVCLSHVCWEADEQK